MADDPPRKVDYSDKIAARRKERADKGRNPEQRMIARHEQEIAKLWNFINNMQGGNGIRWENGTITYDPPAVGQPTYAEVDLCDGSVLRVPGGEIIPPQTP